MIIELFLYYVLQLYVNCFSFKDIKEMLCSNSDYSKLIKLPPRYPVLIRVTFYHHPFRARTEGSKEFETRIPKQYDWVAFEHEIKTSQLDLMDLHYSKLSLLIPIYRLSSSYNALFCSVCEVFQLNNLTYSEERDVYPYFGKKSLGTHFIHFNDFVGGKLLGEEKRPYEGNKDGADFVPLNYVIESTGFVAKVSGEVTKKGLPGFDKVSLKGVSYNFAFIGQDNMSLEMDQESIFSFFPVNIIKERWNAYLYPWVYPRKWENRSKDSPPSLVSSGSYVPFFEPLNGFKVYPKGNPFGFQFTDLRSLALFFFLGSFIERETLELALNWLMNRLIEHECGETRMKSYLVLEIPEEVPLEQKFAITYTKVIAIKVVLTDLTFAPTPVGARSLGQFDDIA